MKKEISEEDQIEEECLQYRYNEKSNLKPWRLNFDNHLKKQKPERDTAKQFRRSQLNVKLLKSIISKFEGPNLDWLKFWSHFEREIDLADIKTGSNFS